jgi:hypothetical protein
MEEQFLPSLFAISLFETPSLFQTAILSLSDPQIFLCLIVVHLLQKLNILSEGVAIRIRT